MVTIAETTGVAGTGTSITLSSLAVPGALRIYMISCAAVAAPDVPAGWTAHYNDDQGNGSLLVASEFYQEGEGSTVFQLNSNTTAASFGVALTGVDQDSLVVAVDGGSTSTSVVAPSATPVAADSLLLTFHAITRSPSGASTTTMTTPTGMTLEQFNRPTSSNGHVALGASQVLASTAATGTRTSVASGSGNWRAATIIATSPAPSFPATRRTDFEPFLTGF